MKTEYTEKIRFSKLEEGDTFTFRKNGQVGEFECYEMCWRQDDYICIDGVYKYTNVFNGFGPCNIKNHRCWVWRIPHKDKGEKECKGCVSAWNFPNDKNCKNCSRRYKDNYRKEV